MFWGSCSRLNATQLIKIHKHSKLVPQKSKGGWHLWRSCQQSVEMSIQCVDLSFRYWSYHVLICLRYWSYHVLICLRYWSYNVLISLSGTEATMCWSVLGTEATMCWSVLQVLKHPEHPLHPKDLGIWLAVCGDVHNLCSVSDIEAPGISASPEWRCP